MTRYGLFARNGDCYAIRDSMTEAELARLDAARYLDEAATCGHPGAAGWVAKRLPFEVRLLAPGEASLILEDGIPVLDREP